MAPIRSQPSKLFAQDIVRYSDVELDQYLEANRRLVEVEDPENLPEDFIQRLRVRAGPRGTGQTCPIDLDNLMTRLQDISANRKSQTQSPSPHASAIRMNISGYTPPLEQRASDLRSRETTEPLDEEENYPRDLAVETDYYNTLIREGGRPSHPVSLGRDVLEDPGEHREILSYWQLVNHDAEGRVWKVFGSQMCEWQRFRRWQRKNREEDRFHKYVEGVKVRLVNHGFTRPFELDEDPDRQDKLTTWIEYLDFQYRWYDKKMRSVKRHQPLYDEAWNKLVSSQVLRPFETEEFICNIDSAFQRASERMQAEKAVKSANAAMISAQKAINDPQRSSLSEQEPQQRLAAAQSKLDATLKTLKSIERRSDLVYEFKKTTMNYQSAKRDAERRSILLRWMLKQVPLIELELSPAKLAENDSNRPNGGKRMSKCNRADESSEEQVSKRQRQGGESNQVSDRRTRASTAKKRESQLNEGRASRRPKRNGQNPNLHKTSDIANLTLIREPIAIQPIKTLDTGSIAVGGAKARTIRHSASRRTRPEACTPGKVVLDRKARVVKRGRGGENSSNLSTLASTPKRRRGSRMRKPPDRFQ